jgi:hypothetical protein
LSNQAKQRREAAEAFRKGGRDASAAKELAELAILEEFMPVEATDAEIDEAVALALDAVRTAPTSTEEYRLAYDMASRKCPNCPNFAATLAEINKLWE